MNDKALIADDVKQDELQEIGIRELTEEEVLTVAGGTQSSAGLM